MRKLICRGLLLALGLGFLSSPIASAVPLAVSADNIGYSGASPESENVGDLIERIVYISPDGDTDPEEINALSFSISLSKPASSQLSLADADKTTAGDQPIINDDGIDEDYFDAVGDFSDGVQTVYTLEDTLLLDEYVDLINDDLVGAGTLAIRPDVPGTYTVTLTALDNAGDPVIDLDLIIYADSDQWTCQAYSSDPCSQLVGGVATLRFDHVDAASYVVEVNGMSIANADTMDTGTIELVGGAAGAPVVKYPTSQLQFTPAIDDEDLVLSLTSTSAGTATVTATKLVDGVPSTVYTQKVTWIASGTNAISAANSFVGTVTDDDCGAPTSSGAAAAIITADGLQTDYYDGLNSANVCVYTFDGNGAALTPATVTVFLGKGWVADTDDGNPTASSASLTPGAGVSKGTLEGDGLQTGLTTITAIITDAQGNVITETAPFVWFGDAASLKLENNYYANNYAAAAADTSLGQTSQMISLSAKDAGGNVVPYAFWAAANTGINTADSAASLIVSSSKGNGSTATLRGQSNAFATVTVNDANDDGESGKANGQIEIVCAEAKYEKLTITAVGLDTVLGTNTMKSNSVDFYCSGAADKVEVTVTGTSVNVKVTDANGFPVADGTTVTLAGSNGSVVAPSQKTTYNGTFATAATMIPSNTAASSTVTAIVGSKSGTSAAIAGTGTSVESQIASLVAAIAKLQKAIAKINKRLKR